MWRVKTQLTRAGYCGAWNPGEGSTIQAQPQPAWPASQRRSARRPDTAKDCHGPRASTYGQDWSSFPVRKASPRPPAAPQCLQLTARRTHRYRQEQRHGGADAGQSVASTYTVSQLSHRLAGQHRTRADGPDTRRILTCGYGSATLTGRLALNLRICNPRRVPNPCQNKQTLRVRSGHSRRQLGPAQRRRSRLAASTGPSWQAALRRGICAGPALAP